LKTFKKTGATALCLMGLALPATDLDAQSALPLTGPALVLADEAYKAFARGDYAVAREKASEAFRQRPDAVQLQKLIRRAESAQRPAAVRASPKARRAQTRPPLALAETAPARTAPRTDPAFAAAAEGYKAYDRAAYAAAVLSAQEAVRLAPLNRDYRLLLVNALLAEGRLPEAGLALTAAIDEAGDDGSLAVRQQSLRRRMQDTQAFTLGSTAYSDFERGDFASAASNAGQALLLVPDNREYRALLVSSLYRNGQYPEAERQASAAIDRAPGSSLHRLRGLIRKRMGLEAAAREDFEASLRMNELAAADEIGLQLDLGRRAEARQRFAQAQANGSLAALSGAELAYLAVRVGDDKQALQAFNRADATGKLRSSAWGDAAFAAVRAGEDAQAIGYFKRTIDEVGALKLALTPQLLFETRRAVAEVSRVLGAIASLSYRGGVSGSGLPPGAATDSLQAGAEAYWRPWGFRNGRYTEVFVRGFETLYSKGGGATGSETLQTAVGIRHKPLTDVNLVASISRVFAPSGGRDDWLAQLAYSGGTGGDLRVDVPFWWTSRVSAETGRYLSAGQSYALAQADLGRSIRVGESGKWVVFPHLSLAADYNSAALSRSSAGIGPGIAARYWFREDVYNAPRSYLDFSLQSRGRLAGAPRAGGVFLTTTLSY